MSKICYFKFLKNPFGYATSQVCNLKESTVCSKEHRIHLKYSLLLKVIQERGKTYSPGVSVPEDSPELCLDMLYNYLLFH